MSDEHNQEAPEQDPLADHGGWLGDLSRFWPSMSGTRQLILGGVVLVLFVSGVVLAWRQFGPQIVTGAAYAVKAEEIAIVPARPTWIKTDIKAAVLRDGGLKELNILDPQLTLRVAQAFSAHSWVKEVRRVSKHHPNRLQVELVYRRPAAMVEVLHEGQRGLLPVDEEGVLLPPNDFSEVEARDYPRIGLGSTSPAGPVGTSWGDPRVAGAAAIATTLRDLWQELHLYGISLAPALSDGTPSPEGVFEVVTWRADQQDAMKRVPDIRITWGHAPGKEPPGEATAAQKVARLTQFVKEHGQDPGLRKALQPIDLRTGQPLKHEARRRNDLLR